MPVRLLALLPPPHTPPLHSHTPLLTPPYLHPPDGLSPSTLRAALKRTPPRCPPHERASASSHGRLRVRLASATAAFLVTNMSEPAAAPPAAAPQDSEPSAPPALWGSDKAACVLRGSLAGALLAAAGASYKRAKAPGALGAVARAGARGAVIFGGYTAVREAYPSNDPLAALPAFVAGAATLSAVTLGAPATRAYVLGSYNAILGLSKTTPRTYALAIAGTALGGAALLGGLDNLIVFLTGHRFP